MGNPSRTYERRSGRVASEGPFAPGLLVRQHFRARVLLTSSVLSFFFLPFHFFLFHLAEKEKRKKLSWTLCKWMGYVLLANWKLGELLMGNWGRWKRAMVSHMPILLN